MLIYINVIPILYCVKKNLKMSSVSEEKRELLNIILNSQPTEHQIEEAGLNEVGNHIWLWDEEILEEMTVTELADIINCIKK